jgi:hypothetical protein
METGASIELKGNNRYERCVALNKEDCFIYTEKAINRLKELSQDILLSCARYSKD